MKTLLICPAFRPAVQQLAETRPLVLTEILGECLVSHWIEHLAALGAREVKIVAADRAEEVRTAVGDGARWGVKIEVIAVSIEPTPAEAIARYQPSDETGWLPAPNNIVLLSHLPGCPDLPLFASYASWFAALVAWMPRAITPIRVRVSEILPGLWVSRRARISPTAKLIAPCWIGDQAFVEPGAIVGPGAIIEDRAVVERDACVTQSWVAADTFVGRLVLVMNSLADGSTLVNWGSDSSLHVLDPFLLCSLARPRPSAPGSRLNRAPGLPARVSSLPQPAASPLAWIAAWRGRPASPQDSKISS